MRRKIALLLVFVIATTIMVACRAEQTECKPTENETIISTENTVPEESTNPTETTEKVEPETTEPSIPSESAHEHEFVETKTEPTCTDAGKIVKTCECGEIVEETIEPLGHTYKDEVIKPTYTSEGYTKHVCEVCGHETKDTYVDKVKHDHDYSEKKYSPKCEEQGYTKFTCKLCGKTYKDNYVDATGHDYKTKTVEPTYTSKGYDVHTCSVCDKSYKDNYKDEIPHEHQNKEKVKEPTCTEGGYTTYTCTICSYETKGNEKTKLGHDYKVETVKPTAKEKGYDLHTCTRCKDSYKDNYTDPVVTYKEVNETVYANTTVNIRKGPGTEYDKLGSLNKGDSITRVGIGDNGWSKVEYNGSIAYMFSEYLQTTKPPVANTSGYPMTYSDGSCTITIYKEWYKNAYVYAAHLQFSDYNRFGTDCANGAYNNGYETTSHAAKRLGAIFAVNGCYSSPNLDYTVVRHGKIWNGSGRATFWCPAVYSFHNGKLLSAWDSGGTPGISGGQIDQLVADGKVTDTFCFGPPSLINGVVQGKNEGARAQRTFIGTNGNAGDIWVCVSDGRYNDGKSPGLTFYEAAEFLKEKGCTFGVHLDGGGSSTMYFNGKVLNAASGGQRAVVDFLYFK